MRRSRRMNLNVKKARRHRKVAGWIAGKTPEVKSRTWLQDEIGLQGIERRNPSRV
jgi:hypothetical protein